MITTALTGAITGLCAIFGIKLSLAQIAGLWIFVKIVVVMGIFGLAAKFFPSKKKLAALPPADAVTESISEPTIEGGLR